MAGEAFPEAERLSLETFDGLLAGMPDDARWELIGGRFVPATMGEPWEHALIVGNIARSLSTIFRATGSPFWTFTETFYLKSGALASAMLPDVIVGSGILEPGATSLENPTVLFEVLSPETEARDRNEKWQVYRQLPSLRHYVLVTRDRPLADVFDRAGEEWISRRLVDGLDAVLELPALGAALPFAAIYHRVITP